MSSRIILSEDDVVSIDIEDSMTGASTATMRELAAVLEYWIYQNTNLTEEKANSWVVKGIACKALQVGSKWKNGKVRIRLEFIPDDVESPLDDLRSQLKPE